MTGNPHDGAEKRLPAIEPLSELDEELLAVFVGRELTRDPEHPVWSDARFLDWLAAETRAQAERGRRVSDAEFTRRGEEFMARVHAKALGIRRGGGAPLSGNVGRVKEASRVPPVFGGPVPVVELGIAAGVGRELWDEPVESWVELPADVPPGKYVALQIVGESMAPLMHTGDTVLVRIGSRVQRDTVIVARHPEDGYVCKRVLHLRRDEIELCSLEAGRPNITIPRDPKLIVGTVILVWCHHRH